MVVDWDSDSSGLELDRRELVLGWQHEISTGGVGESAKGSPGPIAQPDTATGRLLRAQSVSRKLVF